MKKLLQLALLAGMGITAIPALCQAPSNPTDIFATSLTFPLRNPPQSVTGISAQLLDNPGSTTYCYWIVANFLIGSSSPSAPLCVTNGPSTLVSGIRVNWNSVTGALNYDVLRTSTPTTPSGACGCAVATANTTLTVTDTGVGAYTVNTFAPGAFKLVCDNEQSAAGQSQLVCRANGVPVLTLSSAGALGIPQQLNLVNLLESITAPTITAAGCGGAAAAIQFQNGTATFTINVGTTPGSACTVTMPAAANDWVCMAVDVTTNSTSVFLQKQTATSSTSITITNFSDVAVATAFVASDKVKVECQAE